jgi:YopX protein
MDVMSINWEQGIVVCVFDRKGYVSLIEDGYLLQYTDRKDKYKKEIFEGHIISEQDHLGEKPPMEVYWDDTLSGFRCRHGVYQGPLPESKHMEVIGNIYENPELLMIESL